MFKRFSYKQKMKILPAVFALAILLVYLFAIRETLKVKEECHELTGQIKMAENAPLQLTIIRNKLDELNMVMGKDSIASGTDPLLEFVSSSNANMRINLVDYQPLHVYQHQNYQVETRVVVFEGTYTKLVKFLYHFENEFKAGKVVSVKFETETNFKTDRKRLLMMLYIQSVKNGELKVGDEKLQSKS
jgi:hypothetical protein